MYQVHTTFPKDFLDKNFHYTHTFLYTEPSVEVRHICCKADALAPE